MECYTMHLGLWKGGSNCEPIITQTPDELEDDQAWSQVGPKGKTIPDKNEKKTDVTNVQSTLALKGMRLVSLFCPLKIPPLIFALDN